MIMTDLKIAVYAISKNENQFVDRWAKSAEVADFVIVGDTGSDDGTANKLRDHLGFRVTHLNVIPWRFDDARNAVLNQIPTWIDVCVSLDLDEVLPEDWRERIESVWTPDTHIGWYDFVWSHDAEGLPSVSFQQHKIHSRYGWRWKSPVHEDLVWYGEGLPNNVLIPLTIHHWPDDSKSRSSYLPLLEVAVREDPTNWRMSHYYGRELMYRAEYEAAIEELFRCAQGTEWVNEKAVSYIYISDCYIALDNLEWAENYAQWATENMSDLREAWVQRFKVAKALGSDMAVVYAQKALDCTERHATYMNNSYAWDGSLEKEYAKLIG